MPIKLPRDATLRDVYPHLVHPQQYVGGIYQKLRAVAQANGNASVKIGTTGTGQRPYYRVFYFDANDPRTEIIEGSYFDNHKSFADEDLRGDAINYNWSTASMNCGEVKEWADGLRIGRAAKS